MPQALEGIQITTIDCIYIGDSTARKHLFSVLLALNRVEYRGRIVIVAYSLELTAPHGAGVTIDLRGIARLRPERFAEDCRQQYGLRVERGRSRADRVFPLSGEPPLSRGAASCPARLSGVPASVPRQPRPRDTVRKSIGLGPVTHEAKRHPLRCLCNLVRIQPRLCGTTTAAAGTQLAPPVRGETSALVAKLRKIDSRGHGKRQWCDARIQIR